MAIRIKCINKAAGDHENPYIAISRLGWVNDATGAENTSTRLDMYEWVKNGGVAIVVGGDTQARLIAEETVSGTKYVRTIADSSKQDNLLNLPECH
jgi:hypothetical protein